MIQLTSIIHGAVRRARRGFTLIEMLIVVAIIGILASLVLVGLGPVQRQGRDARRISDLRQVQTGLELYFVKNGDYPASQAWSELTTTLTGAGIGVSNVPQDPSSASGKTYQYGSNGSSYVVAAGLEDTGSSRLGDDSDGFIMGISCADPVYCIQL